MSRRPAHNTAREGLLSRIKIHPRYQDERTQTLIKLTILIVILAELYEWSRTIKTPYNNAPFTGRDYVEFILTGNQARCKAMFRLTSEKFEELSQKLSNIDSNPISKLISMDEQLAVFMYIVGQGATNRQAQDRFQHSGENISKVFHHIIALVCRLGPTYIREPKPDFTHRSIKSNPKFSPFFNQCLGALDGVHIPAKVPKHLSAPYRNQKGQLSQNVLGVVDFDM
jgi:hypothetical protein